MIQGEGQLAGIAQRRAILFQAWQLALMLHPEMKRRVGEPMLAQPARKLEAIAAVERQLADKPEDADAWDVKRLIYSQLTEADYVGGGRHGQNPSPNSTMPTCSNLAWPCSTRPTTGSEAANISGWRPAVCPWRHRPFSSSIGKVHEAHGDMARLWENCQKAIQAARSAGVANLKAEDRDSLFTVVKQLGEQAMSQGNIDDALALFKFYSQSERPTRKPTAPWPSCSNARPRRPETRGAILDEQKDEAQESIWLALHCTQHGLTYDGSDKDLLERKDRYYYSIDPAEVKQRWESIHLWFDVDYCIQKTNWLMERYQTNLDLLDWAAHLAELAQVAQPHNLTAKLMRARIRRARGEMAESTALLEEIRQNRPEKFATDEDLDSWFVAHRLLGDAYLDEKPAQAVECLSEFRKSERAGADTLYKLGRAFENLGDMKRAARCYEGVTAFEKHPLFYEARAALERVKRTV